MKTLNKSIIQIAFWVGEEEEEEALFLCVRTMNPLVCCSFALSSSCLCKDICCCRYIHDSSFCQFVRSHKLRGYFFYYSSSSSSSSSLSLFLSSTHHSSYYNSCSQLLLKQLFFSLTHHNNFNSTKTHTKWQITKGAFTFGVKDTLELSPR